MTPLNVQSVELVEASEKLLKAYDDGKPLYPRMLELRKASENLKRSMKETAEQENLL